MKNPRVKIMEDKLIQVSFLPKGSAYFMYKIPKVTRGIRGKSKGKVDELLIVGVPFSQMEQFCEKNEFIITDRAVYQYNMRNPILFRKDDTFTYVLKEQL